jgi:hypothetical protein
MSDRATKLYFENPVELSETDYVGVFGVGKRHLEIWRVIVGLALGLICLWSPYTLLLGICMLTLSAISMITPRLLPVGARARYRRSSVLREPMTCGVSDDLMWLKGQSFHFESSWRHLEIWRERHGWFVLSPHGMSPVFLNVAQLRNAGVYERVRALAQEHAQEFGAPRQASLT